MSGKNRIPRETRICENPNCDITFEVRITSSRKFCCVSCIWKGRKRSEEFKRNRREEMKNRWQDPEYKKMLHEACLGRVGWSRGLTKETHPSLASASKKKTGRIQSEETKEKKRKKLKGRSYVELHGEEEAKEIIEKKRQSLTGYKQSEEHRKKNGENKRKYFADPENRKRQSRRLKEFFATEEGIEARKSAGERMRLFMKNRYEQGFVSSMKGRTGERHPNWHGGPALGDYPLNFNEELKTFIKTRDNYICQLCGKTEIDEKKELDRGLAVHHIDHDRQNCEPENLITLCCSCNSKVNYSREFWTNFFKLKLKKCTFV